MRTIHVVTHPEATHHISKVVGGWHDSALTPVGEKAAHSIATALRAAIPADAPVDLITSDLLRTRQTADAIASVFGVQPVLDKRLREKSYGVAEGRPQAWLDARFVPPPAVGDRMGHYEGIEGSETKESLAQRVYAAMDDVLGLPGPHQIVVTHGFALTFVIAAWIGMPVEAAGLVNFRAASGSITTLREDDFFHNRQVASLGDVQHLAS